MKWIGLLGAVILITACFMTWVTIPVAGQAAPGGQNGSTIVVTGVDATGTNFGKPAYFHFICSFFFLLFLFLPKVWAKRTNLFVTAINLAWAIRNYFIITACRAGDCPEKHVAIYLILIASALMLAASMFPDMKPVRNDN